jgi:MoxR-like ATPase
MSKSFCQRCHQPFEVTAQLTAQMSGSEIICPVCGKRTELSFDLSPPVPKPKLTIPFREDVPVPPSPGGGPPPGPKQKITLPPVEPHKAITLSEVAAVARQIIDNVERVIVGKHAPVTTAVAVLMAEGHLLLEDVPGVAKTMLARAIALSTGCTFKRIQCTPDLQPSDVLGETYLDPQTGRTEFRFGALFSQIVLVDEINRASPRTQAALLEAMGEAMVTLERVTYRLQHPFMVIATQNPIDQEGTFLLPEAQKDRFLVRLSLGYPALADEKQMVERFQLRHPIDTLQAVTFPDRITECQQAVREVRVSSEVLDYILALTQATRRHPALSLGASPRGSLALFRAGQALAAIQGNDTVTAAQVREIAQTVLAHRVIVRQDPPHLDLDPAEVIQTILEKTPLPG